MLVTLDGVVDVFEAEYQRVVARFEAQDLVEAVGLVIYAAEDNLVLPFTAIDLVVALAADKIVVPFTAV